jgi:hypothetical protein
MKAYPSIPKNVRGDVPIIAFDKLDGSNIRAEWSREHGFYKFGTRTRLLGPDELPLGEAIPLIQSKYERALSDIFSRERYESAVAFFEFFGPSSAFGQHTQELHDVVLLDVSPYKMGLLEPRVFLKLFGDLHVPGVLYEGKANTELARSVEDSTLEGMTFEGVVCKGPNDKKAKMPIMFKLKSAAWKERLRSYCKGDDKLFETLL